MTDVPWDEVERLVPGYSFVFGCDRAIRKMSTGEIWYLGPLDTVPEWMVERRVSPERVPEAKEES